MMTFFLISICLAINGQDPQDLSLYKLLLLFSDDQGKMKVVEEPLNKFLNLNIRIPRGDLMFYVEVALDCHRRDLA